MTALILATLLGTLPLWEPANPATCDTTLSGRPETRLMGALIRHRFIGGAWRDTVRYRLRTTDRPGQPCHFPYIHHPVPMEFQIALVDSAGNVGCWGNIVRKDP